MNGYSTVSEKIALGEYNSKLTHPERLKRPTMPSLGVTPEIARKFADDLEKFEKNEAEIKKAREAYRRDVNRLEHEVFRADLEAEYGTADHPKAQKLWDKAWEHGHSGGLNNVLYWYDEFYELIA